MDARSVLGPEELDLASGSDEAGDADTDERSDRARTVGMEIARDQLLPASGLPGDLHRSVMFGDTFDLVAEGVHDGAAPDGLRRPQRLALQPDVLSSQLRCFERPPDRKQELCHG